MKKKAWSLEDDDDDDDDDDDNKDEDFKEESKVYVNGMIDTQLLRHLFLWYRILSGEVVIIYRRIIMENYYNSPLLKCHSSQFQDKFCTKPLEVYGSCLFSWKWNYM